LKLIQKIKNIVLFDSYGAIATASFLVCTLSGMVLAISYDINNAYESISIILIANPAANFFRNIHYWSAQFFLIFTILHIWEHLKLGTEQELSHGIWFRLSLSVFFIFLVMITGFILKADPDSQQAYRIVSSLFAGIPLIGKSISSALLGYEGDLQVVYIHHIATATIFLVIVIWEHAKKLWTRGTSFLIVLIGLSIMSLVFHAPLHTGLSPVVKGPWYFVGMQEILHWMSRPQVLMVIIFGMMVLFYFIYHFKERISGHLKKGLLILFYGYMMLTITGYFFRGENWSWETPWDRKYISGDPFRSGIEISDISLAGLTKHNIPQSGERKEGCMICHQDVTGFAAAHDPTAIGCASCHLGDPFSLDKNRAHRNMVLIPGNLSNAHQTCGSAQCHPEIVPRINNSLMTTNSGIVSVNRWVFHESDSPDIFSHILQIGHSAADQHLRNLCAKCHLGNPKIGTGPIDELSRGGGCTACHLNYSEEGVKQHLAYLAANKNGDVLPKLHPSLDIKISNDHCFGCHSRSGRISTNYEGWHETLLDESDTYGKGDYRILQDKRVFEYVSEDVHHKAGMDCIDCHNSFEVMGDGQIYLHQEQAVKIRCEDCHFNERPQLAIYNELDTESKKIFDLRKFRHKEKLMIREKGSGITLINTFLENDSAFMVGKNSGQRHPMNQPPSICTKAAHESLTCSACHTAWAPQCIGCHNKYDSNADGYDLLANQPLTGTWVEYVGNFMAEPPTLGVRMGDKKQVLPAIPGMILSIDRSTYPSDDSKSPDESDIIFHRLFAPAEPHTTSSKGRSCKSCHNDPLAIGYGHGELNFNIDGGKGKWIFKPQYAPNKYDGLPEDAWIAFNLNLHDGTEKSNLINLSTRTNFRPFNLEEQQRILLVGACLTCHEENTPVIAKSLEVNMVDYLKEISEDCIIPDW